MFCPFILTLAGRAENISAETGITGNQTVDEAGRKQAYRCVSSDAKKVEMRRSYGRII